jgi:hypothetical protein
LIDAKACARAAKQNAVIKLGLGYDFGFCSPGSIRRMDEGSDYEGKFEVCIP